MILALAKLVNATLREQVLLYFNTILNLLYIILISTIQFKNIDRTLF